MKVNLRGLAPAVFSATVSMIFWLSLAPGDLRGESKVSFTTEDGWKLHGSLFLPEKMPASPMPAVLLLTEPGWIYRTTFAGYLANDLA